MALRRFSAFLACFIFFLVIAGGMVTSTGSALAVPDWPLSFGQVFPRMEGGVFYEHGHRMIAATAGMLTIVLAIWLFRTAKDSFLKKAGWIALGLVCVQGVLGGVTVLLKLPALTSVSHACLGQIYFSWMSCIAATLWSDRTQAPYADATKLRRLALLTTGLAFFQLMFGAIYRHTGMLLEVHMAGAVLVFIHVLLLARRLRRTLASDLWFARLGSILMGLVFIQVGLGLYTWQRPTIPNATAHVAVGALILMGSAVTSLQTFRRVRPA